MEVRNEAKILENLVQEKNILDNRYERLARFLVGTAYTRLSIIQKNALVRQVDAMREYSLCLRDRILDLQGEENE